jgi:putative alpha-1,2-mannosidase
VGFYPVCPGVPEYVLGSPLFDSVTLTFPDGKQFEIKTVNNSPEHKYIRSARLNGASYQKTFLRHADIVKGGQLILEITGETSTWFGRGPETAPYSMSEEE